MVFVKAVRILHDEFAATHEPKPRTTLVAELGLDLVKILGQLLVAAQFLSRNISHNLLTGGLHDEVTSMTVLNAQQLRAHLVKAPGFLPVLSRLDHGHGHFNGPGMVHFLAHDGFDFLNDTQTHGHIGVDTRAQFFDHARTGHELVTDHFSVGRRLFEGGNEELGSFHGVRSHRLRGEPSNR